jgi:hypothetical protein
MSEVQEKDNFWLIVGGLILTTVILVGVLKSRETEHLKSGAVAQLQTETFSKIEKRHTSNNSSAAQMAGK